MFNYSTTNANKDIGSATSERDLNLVLQKIVHELGYSEAIFWSKYSPTFNHSTLETLMVNAGAFERMIAQQKVSFLHCYREQKRLSKAMWDWQLDVFNVESMRSTGQTVQCTYTQDLTHFGIALFLAPLSAQISNQASEALQKNTPYLLHLNHLLSEKMVQMRKLRQEPQFTNPPDTWSQSNPLTQRELEILRLTAAGKIAEDIATDLGITPRTVSFHIAQIMNVLQVSNKTAAVSKAIVRGWIFE